MLTDRVITVQTSLSRFGANIFPLKAFSPHLTDGFSWALWLAMSNPSTSASLFSCGSTPPGFGQFHVFFEPIGSVGRFSVELPGVPSPVRFEIAPGIPNLSLTQFTHIVVTVTKDFVVSLYLNGQLAELQTEYGRVQATADPVLFTLAPPNGLTFNGWNDCGFGRPSAGLPQVAGQLDSLEMYSRGLSDSDINMLARNVLSTGARASVTDFPPASVPNPTLDSATAVWNFQHAPTTATWALVTAPSGVGSVAAVDGPAPIDLADPTHNPDVTATLSTFPSTLGSGDPHAIVMWVLVRGFKNSVGGFTNWPGCTLFGIALSATGTDADDEFKLQVTGTRALQVVYLSKILTTVDNVVTPWTWMHIAIVQSSPSLRVPTRLYANGALVGWSTTFGMGFAGGPRPNAVIGRTVTGSGLMRLFVAQFAVWDPTTQLFESQLLELVSKPPANIAGAIGTPFEMLMRLAAAYYNCSEPPVNAGWVPGLAPNSGLCVFNGLPRSASGPQGSYLRLDGTTDLKSSQPMPVQFASVENTIASGWTFHWQLTAESAPHVGNISLLWCDAPASVEGVPAAGHISISMDFARFGTIRYKQYNTLATDPVCDVSVPMALQPGLLQRQLQITVVVEIEDANTLHVSAAINGVFAGPATCANAAGVLTMPIVQTRECRFGTNTDVTGERFHGRLARFAWWTRLLQMNDLALLESNAAVAVVGANPIGLPAPGWINPPSSLFEFLTPFALGAGQTLTAQGPVASSGFTVSLHAHTKNQCVHSPLLSLA